MINIVESYIVLLCKTSHREEALVVVLVLCKNITSIVIITHGLIYFFFFHWIMLNGAFGALVKEANSYIA